MQARAIRPAVVASLSRDPVVAEGLLMAKIGPVLLVYNDERITDAAWAKHLAELARVIDEQPESGSGGVVYDVPSASAFTGERRAALGNLLKGREAKLRKTTGGYALATGSSLARAYLRALFWIAPPPYPNAVVSNVHDGLAFVARRVPDVDPIATGNAWTALMLRHGMRGV